MYCYLQLGWHPLAVVQYTFTHKQYIEKHSSLIRKIVDRTQSLWVIPWNLPYNCGKKHGKTLVKVDEECKLVYFTQCVGFIPPGFHPRTVQPVARRYTDWAIAAELYHIGYHYFYVDQLSVYYDVLVELHWRKNFKFSWKKIYYNVILSPTYRKRTGLACVVKIRTITGWAVVSYGYQLEG